VFDFLCFRFVFLFFSAAWSLLGFFSFELVGVSRSIVGIFSLKCFIFIGVLPFLLVVLLRFLPSTSHFFLSFNFFSADWIVLCWSLSEFFGFTLSI